MNPTQSVTRNLGRLVAAIGLFALLTSPVAWAEDCSYEGGGSGHGTGFSLSSSWSCGHVPGASDRAIFDLEGDHNVLFTQNITNDRLSVRDDDVTLQLSGRTYTLASAGSTSLIIGGSTAIPPNGDAVNGFLTLQGGTLSSVASLIGGGFIGSGQATVSAGATWNNSGVLSVGTGSLGTLIVQGGGHVNALSATLGGNFNGHATVTGTGSTWTLGSTLAVNHGSLSILSGGAVSNGVATVGGASNQTAIVTVGGGGAAWTCSDDLTIGLAGNGTLNVQADGVVDADAFLGETFVGDQDNAVGTVTVSGANAICRTRGLRVGNQGSGMVNVSAGGTMLAYGHTTIGHTTLGFGNVLVTGADANWYAGNSIFVGGNSTAAGGPGLLTIGHGANVETYAAERVRLWPFGTLRLVGGTLNTGQLIMSGGAFEWIDGTLKLTNTPALDIGPGGLLGADVVLAGSRALQLWSYPGELRVGDTGPGTIQLIDSSSVFAGYAAVGDHAAGIMTASGPDVNVTIGSLLTVGRFANGTMSILDGATCDSGTDGPTHRCAAIGETAGVTGTVIVDGDGSTWTSIGYDTLPADFLVGQWGRGVLHITGGGAVAHEYVYATLGVEPGSEGEVLVSGAGSTWDIPHSLTLGQWGIGSLAIESGGQVTCGGVATAQISGSSASIIVDGAGSTWAPASLSLAGEGPTDLTIRNGGAVHAGDTYLAYGAGSTATVDVEGPGSTFTASPTAGEFGYLIVGSASTASLHVSDGATVSAGETIIGDGSTGRGSITVSGPGSNLTSVEALALGFAPGSIGSMSIENGASVETPAGYIGYGANTTGTVNVTGDGSVWGLDELFVDYGGASAELTISAGGRVHAAETATIRESGAVMLDDGILAAMTVDVAGGMLGGEGEVVGDMFNAGTVSPGLPLGGLHIAGDYVQHADGVLEIDVPDLLADTADGLSVSGQARLGGTLRVSLIGGGGRPAARSFTILTAGSVTGRFDEVVIDGPHAGRMVVSYKPNAVVVQVRPVMQRDETPALQSAEMSRVNETDGD